MSTQNALILIIALMTLIGMFTFTASIVIRLLWENFSKTYSIKMQEKWFNSLYEAEKQIIIKFWKDNVEIKKLIPTRHWRKVIHISENHLNSVLKQRKR